MPSQGSMPGQGTPGVATNPPGLCKVAAGFRNDAHVHLRRELSVQGLVDVPVQSMYTVCMYTVCSLPRTQFARGLLLHVSPLYRMRCSYADVMGSAHALQCPLY